MKIGYARFSTPSRKLDRQIAAHRSAGCVEFYWERASGKATRGRTQLEPAFDALGTDDVLATTEWDRASRSMMDGIKIMQRIADRGALITVLDKPHLDLAAPIGPGLLVLLSLMDEDERSRIVGRAADGRKFSRAKCVRLGPKPKLSDHQRDKIRERLAGGDSCREIARELGASHSAISRLR